MTEIIRSLRNVLNILEGMDQRTGMFRNENFGGFWGSNREYYKTIMSEANKNISVRLGTHELQHLFESPKQKSEAEKKK